MTFRNKQVTMPTIDDIIMQIMALSEALYDGHWTIGRELYNQHRPPTWPTALYLLKFYGYEQNSAGWAEMVDKHIGVEVKTHTITMQERAEIRMQKRWRVNDKPEYTAPPDGAYLAVTGSTGLTVCESIYRRTGRMILR